MILPGNSHPTIRRVMNYTPVFGAAKKAYHDGYRFIDQEGGSRSSKTYSNMQLLILIAQKEPGLISVVSHSLPHLKKGAMRDFMDIMIGKAGPNDPTLLIGMGIYDEKKHNKTDQVYNFSPTSQMEFFGAENAAKVRGPGRRILYVNEANLIDFETFQQLAMRTTGTIIIDYNPADQNSWVYQIRDRRNKAGRRITKNIHSTYRNNLGNLSEFQIEEIENLQYADLNLWNVYGLGVRGSSSETIYTMYNECVEFPEEAIGVEYGLDFGFNHPACLVRQVLWNGKRYVDEMLYESGLTNPDLALAIKILFSGSYNSASISKRNGRIWCDHSRPEAIEEIKKVGLNALPADKSVYSGILSVKAHPLYITRKSTNLLKEIRSYKWKKDPKTDLVLDEPVKFRDDAMDAMRYAIYSPGSKPKHKVLAA